MHALRRIHRSLRPEGLLVDLHPQPEPPAVEVWRGSRAEHVGHIHQHEDIQGILGVRQTLDQMEADGWYVTRSREFFDLIAHFPSIDDWEQYYAEEGYSGSLPEEVRASTRRRMAGGGGEFVVREPIRASLLGRLSRSGDPPAARGGGRSED